MRSLLIPSRMNAGPHAMAGGSHLAQLSQSKDDTAGNLLGQPIGIDFHEESVIPIVMNQRLGLPPEHFKTCHDDLEAIITSRL